MGVNGHIGFNEPDTALRGDFALVPLSETAKTVGKKYFHGRETPKEGATITLEALNRAETVIVMATGESKRQAVRQVLGGNCEIPAGAFLDHPNAWYILDEAAVSEDES